MKCPKCSYLGFETGDRCKNCGYDFSLLLSSTSPIDAELSMREPEATHTPDVWLDRIDTGLSGVASRTAPEPAAAPSATKATAVSTVTPSSPELPRELSFPLFAPERDE